MIKKSPILFSSASFTHLFLISAAVVLFDQVTKFLALHFLTLGVSRPILEGIFHLTLVLNRGAAFGIFKGSSFIFTLVSLVSIIAIILLWKRDDLFLKIFCIDSNDRTLRFSLALILGGAAGNLVDRLRYFCVVDFLDFRIWPVFNLADSAITIGAVLIFFKFLKITKRS